MMDILLILTLGALSGFVVAQFVSWAGLLWCGPVVASISAAILQKHGFDWLSGIAITVACLILNQIGYLIGAHFNIKPTSHHARDARTTLPINTKGTKPTHPR
jgi:hypothetical protein